MTFSNQLDADLTSGIDLAGCVRRLSSYMDAWVAGHSQWCKHVELRLSRLESVAKIDKRTLDEVDTSVRQSWEALDERLKALEERWKPTE